MQYVYAGKTNDNDKKQHEGKGKGWACNNHNMRNPSLHFLWGYACYDCCMPIPCFCLHAAPYSHAIITVPAILHLVPVLVPVLHYHL